MVFSLNAIDYTMRPWNTTTIINILATERRRGDDMKARMVAWRDALAIPIGVLALGFIISVGIGVGMQYPTVAAIVLACSVIAAPIALLVNLLGFVFDSDRNALKYPFYIFRRSIRLSGVRDANCQTVTRVHDTSNVTNIVGERGQKQRSKTYKVNLSGDFGVRRVNFPSKAKRDQFLSLLRQYAPQCRITRWT